MGSDQGKIGKSVAEKKKVQTGVSKLKLWVTRSRSLGSHIRINPCRSVPFRAVPYRKIPNHSVQPIRYHSGPVHASSCHFS